MENILNETMTFVLAGGMGERLYPLTRNRAKPSVPFACSYRIIDFTLSNCLNSGLRKMLLLTQYKSLSLERHCREGWDFLNYDMGEYIFCIPPQKRVTDSWYLGTADSIYQNIYTIQKEMPKYVLILSGDHIYKMNYLEMLEHHFKTGADLTVGCRPVDIADGKRYGVMGIDDTTKITEFVEKSPTPPAMPGDPNQCLASMGIYVFSTDALLKELEEDSEKDTAHDFGKNIIPGMVYGDNSNVFAFKFEENGKPAYWRDIGTLDAFWEAHMDLTGVNPVFDIYDKSWPLRTIRRNHPPTRLYSDKDPDHMNYTRNCLISEGCLVHGGIIEDSLIAPECVVNENVHINQSILMSGAIIEKDVKLKKVIVDKHVRVPAGEEIGYNLEEDAKRFHISTDGVVVITPSDDFKTKRK